MNQTNPREVILFFDGICGLCNGFIKFVLKYDRGQIFKFAPLQGETAVRVIPPEQLKHMPSLVLIDGELVLTHSDAALRVLFYLGGIWKVLSFLHYVPRPLRDGCYNIIVRVRYRLFGKVAYCSMLSSAVLSDEVKRRFLP